ncbi:MAG: hypothetical protein NVS4B8_21340 [Herpetosiphon sp.]
MWQHRHVFNRRYRCAGSNLCRPRGNDTGDRWLLRINGDHGSSRRVGIKRNICCTCGHKSCR